MKSLPVSAVNLLLSARARPGSEAAFALWQTRLQEEVLNAPGCRSCEFHPPAPPDQEEWAAVVRFDSVDAVRRWRVSETNKKLVSEAAPLVEGGWVTQLVGGAATEFYVQNSATEIVVTDIKPGKEAEYRAWADRIQKVQDAFPGFRGSYTQPPHDNETGWTTLLRFDTVEKLNAWIESPERAALLRESEDLVDRVVLHRVDTSFPGWIPNDPNSGKPPPVWKTPLLVLLGLFPIIVLEIKYLSPLTAALNPALGTFIGNALSVLLLTWPVMPVIMWAFRDWMFPEGKPPWVAITGPAAIAASYAVELGIFWRFLR